LYIVHYVTFRCYHARIPISAGWNLKQHTNAVEHLYLEIFLNTVRNFHAKGSDKHAQPEGHLNPTYDMTEARVILSHSL
jgi:hypothetical protein